MFKFISTISDEDAKELYGKLQTHLQQRGFLTFQPVLLTDPRAEQQVIVELPIADAPKVEGAKCITNFTIGLGMTEVGDPVIGSVEVVTPFDQSTVKRNPFYFGDSKTTNEPVTQADGVADNKDTCNVCGKEIPPGPDTCSEGCERLWVTSKEYRDAQLRKAKQLEWSNNHMSNDSVPLDERGL